MREEMTVEWDGYTLTVLVYSMTCCKDWTAVGRMGGSVIASAIGPSRDEAIANLRQRVLEVMAIEREAAGA